GRGRLEAARVARHARAEAPPLGVEERRSRPRWNAVDDLEQRLGLCGVADAQGRLEPLDDALLHGLSRDAERASDLDGPFGVGERIGESSLGTPERST